VHNIADPSPALRPPTGSNGDLLPLVGNKQGFLTKFRAPERFELMFGLLSWQRLLHFHPHATG